MIVSITRRFEFDAGHRVLGHEGKCRWLHGHRYVAEVTLIADQLDKIGRVLDFSEVKDLVGNWIDGNWDHNFILHPADPLLLCHNHPQIMLNHSTKVQAAAIFDGRNPYVMPAGYENPTAENMAAVLLDACRGSLLLNVACEVTKVRLYETPNCFAEVLPELYIPG